MFANYLKNVMKSYPEQICLSSLFFKRFYFLFLDSREGWEKEKERNINMWLPLMRLLLGTWPVIQACALTGNGTSDPLKAGAQSIEPHQPGLSSLF